MSMATMGYFISLFICLVITVYQHAKWEAMKVQYRDETDFYMFLMVFATFFLPVGIAALIEKGKFLVWMKLFTTGAGVILGVGFLMYKFVIHFHTFVVKLHTPKKETTP